MTTNKKFKSSIFTSLFNDPNALRELYCALEGVSLPLNTPVEINTLENVLYMDFINDISFEIDGKLVVLIEHQSTINPNMSLRLLLYITRILEKKVKGSSLYTSKKLKIPFPEFFVLYNGTAPFSDIEILRLSDLFENTQNLGLPENTHPFLELEVKIININEGRNTKIANRCKKLAEYTVFIEKVRFFQKESVNLEEAMRKTIQYCEKHDILKEYLEIHGSEVLNLLLEEWNIEDAKKVWREEAREEGHAEGHLEGRKVGREEGRQEGREERNDYFLALLDQGLSVEEIKKRLL
ncbi:MAG: Rpn family recombination-promoting nuclease/putative transposase [Treponema sp.]|nr:Rpn family recombination-promoting nuclease/putative transposase [Treponema sp.]